MAYRKESENISPPIPFPRVEPDLRFIGISDTVRTHFDLCVSIEVNFFATLVNVHFRCARHAF